MIQTVNNPESNGKGSGYPRIIRILRVKITLDDLVALAETVIHFLKEIRMNKIIRVKNRYSIILLIHRKQLVEHPLKSKALALFNIICTLADYSTCLGSNLCRIIGAVIRNYVNIIKFLRIIQVLKIFYQRSDYRRLVMSRNQNSKCRLRCENLLFSPYPQAAKAEHEVINGKKKVSDKTYGCNDSCDHAGYTHSCICGGQ